MQKRTVPVSILKLLAIATLALSCTDNQPENASPNSVLFGGDTDAEAVIIPPENMEEAAPLPPVIDSFVPLDSEPIDVEPPPDPCDSAEVSDVRLYCFCSPQCCELQEWYCPPGPGTSIESMRVTLEICDDAGVACNFGTDPSCPPPEIIDRSPCQVTHECPPGSSRDFLRWFECQLEDGRIGRQRVLCDKGQIVHGLCMPCDEEVCDGEDNDCDDQIDEGQYPCEDECGEGLGVCQDGEIVDCVNRDPSEEVCNFIDDDCDGETDEDQRNACDECGELPQDTCDNIDNDCDGSTDENLIRECETQCGRGLETCIAGNWASCTAQLPTDEECDGLDNDCDGIPDEGLNCACTRDQVGALFPCAEEPLICGQGFKTCVCQDVDCTVITLGPCASICSYFPIQDEENCNPQIGQAIEQEVCNNFDEDCDDLLDESLSRACYTGPRDTLNVGICIPGEQTCIEGRWGGLNQHEDWTVDLCVGEVIPTDEVCNGSDDDCDGEVDYGEEIRDTDILLILDTSGSMGGTIRAVTQALSRFGQHFAAEEAIHWGIIIGPTRAPDPNNIRSNLEVLTLVSDISPFGDFFEDFLAMQIAGFSGGIEMLMDALMLSLRNLAPNHVDLANRRWVRGIASTPDKDNFFLSWRPNTDRIIIVISDEAEQSLMEPVFVNQDLANALAAAPNTKLYTFSSPFWGWDELAVATGGQHFNLSSNTNQMYNNLMSIIDEVCLPRNPAMQGSYLLERSYLLASYDYEHYEWRNMCY